MRCYLKCRFQLETVYKQQCLCRLTGKEVVGKRSRKDETKLRKSTVDEARGALARHLPSSKHGLDSLEHVRL